jgi:uncharacterized membrane protein YbaN (DUF454 family)
MRYVYLAIGLVFVALGVIGAFLPVLPTTPFLLISLWAFANSSPRLECWLLDHPRFGPRLVAWREHKVIPLPVKRTAFASMIVGLSLMALVGRWWAFGIAAGLMAIGATYIATRPSRSPVPK